MTSFITCACPRHENWPYDVRSIGLEVVDKDKRSCAKIRITRCKDERSMARGWKVTRSRRVDPARCSSSNHDHCLSASRSSLDPAMRTRRRPVLQDKTPGNTPQKPKSSVTRAAKPKLVPVVEIKAKVRRSSRGKHAEVNQPLEVDDAGEDSW